LKELPFSCCEATLPLFDLRENEDEDEDEVDLWAAKEAEALVGLFSTTFLPLTTLKQQLLPGLMLLVWFGSGSGSFFVVIHTTL
jgi:hypothetical protein